MTRQRNDLHTKLVETWKNRNGKLSDSDLTLLYINGILAIRRRSLETLSNVTVTAVFDRILIESQARFATLSEIKNDSMGLHFETFLDQLHNSKPTEVHEALEELLLELLEVFGKITADILTKNLHQELMTVTSLASPKHLVPPAAISLGLVRKNRDQK